MTSTKTPRIIAAFDPGTTTGIAWWSNGEFHADQFDIDGTYDWVDTRVRLFDHFQIEKFTISERTIRAARVDDPLDIIGFLKYKARKGRFPFQFSLPATVMNAFPDVALRRASMFTKGKGHANDAARHLAYCLVKNKTLSGSLFLPDD